MPATYTFDVFSSLDGFGSAGGDWGGYRGKQGPDRTGCRKRHRPFDAPVKAGNDPATRRRFPCV